MDNADRVLRRINGDLAFLERCVEVEARTEPHGVAAQCLSEARLQGIVNNLRGFHGELLAAHTAPDVVGLLKRFRGSCASAPKPDRHTGMPGTGPSAHQDTGVRVEPEMRATDRIQPEVARSAAGAPSSQWVEVVSGFCFQVVCRACALCEDCRNSHEPGSAAWYSVELRVLGKELMHNRCCTSKHACSQVCILV